LRELGQQGRGGRIERGYDNSPVGVLSAASLEVTVLYMDCNQAEAEDSAEYRKDVARAFERLERFMV